jgi:4-hydroxy 2-oxovalerate aldolase
VVILLDVSLREAGIANRFAFSLTQAGSIAAALDRAGVDVVEVGYFRPALTAVSGASCAPRYLDTVLRSCTRASVAVMIHLPDVTLGCYKELAARGVSLVRFAVSPADLDSLPQHAGALLEAGLRFTVNAIRATELPPEQVLKTAVCAERLLARCFYIEDVSI